MPILQEYVYGDDGEPIEGAVVEVFEYGNPTPVASTLSRADGRWSLDLPPGRSYRIRYSWGGQVRWLESDVHLQVGSLTGLDGSSAPLLDQSVVTDHLHDEAVTTSKVKDGAITTAKLAPEAVTTEKLKDRSVTQEKLAEGAVTDLILGDRSITDAEPPTSSTGPLTTLLSGLANRLKTLSGGATWLEGAPDNLTNLSNRVTRLETYGAPVTIETFLTSFYDNQNSTVPLTNTTQEHLSVLVPPGTWLFLCSISIESSATSGAKHFSINVDPTGTGISNETTALVSVRSPGNQVTLVALCTSMESFTVKVRSYSKENISGGSGASIDAISSNLISVLLSGRR